MLLYITLYLQNILGYSPFQAGLRFLPLTLLVLLVAPVAGRLSERVPVRVLLGAGRRARSPARLPCRSGRGGAGLSDAVPARPRPGRRPGASGTREAILVAARARFAEVGYDRATIRAIAVQAGVDPALVIRFFGSKQHLFLDAIEMTIKPAAAVPAILEGGLDGLGERLARFYLDVWESPDTRDGLAGAHLVGIAVARYVVKVKPLASAEVDAVVAAVGPTIQRYFTGDAR
jgi:AcrR family transcriptional regulator